MDEATAGILGALVGAVATLVGGSAAAMLTGRSQRQQQARQAMLPPAERFSTAVLVAFATVRTVKPPKPPGGDGRQHRNECLLYDHGELERRLHACEDV